MNIRKKEKIVPNCTAKVKEGFTKGKVCRVEYFDKEANPPRWYVTFDSGWCGWYSANKLERLI